MILQDPSNQQAMGVDLDGRGLTSAQVASRQFYISRDKGDVYSLVSIIPTAQAGNFITYLRNNSTTKYLYIGELHYGTVNAALLKFWEVKGTPGGTAITPENLNRASGRTANVTCYGDGVVAGLTAEGRPLDAPRTEAGGHDAHSFGGAVILGPAQACAVEYDTGADGAAEVMLMFHLEDIERVRK